MKKEEITSFVYNNLLKIDKTNKYHINVIEKAITIAFTQAYTDVFERDPRLLDNYTITYGKTGDTLLTELDGDGSTMYVATIPVTYVPFNDKASAVRHIFTLAKSDTKFYPMSKYEMDIASNTLFGETDDRIGYTVRQTMIEFYNMSAITSIRIDIVQQFDQYDAAEDINMPFGNGQSLVDAVIERLRGIPPVDLTDNNSDQWQTQQR